MSKTVVALILVVSAALPFGSNLLGGDVPSALSTLQAGDEADINQG